MKADEKKYFPMFVDLTQKKVTVIGAGNIAKRRIELCFLLPAQLR